MFGAISPNGLIINKKIESELIFIIKINYEIFLTFFAKGLYEAGTTLHRRLVYALFDCCEHAHRPVAFLTS